MFRRTVGYCLVVSTVNVLNSKTLCKSNTNSDNNIELLFSITNDLYKEQLKQDFELQSLKRDIKSYKHRQENENIIQQQEPKLDELKYNFATNLNKHRQENKNAIHITDLSYETVKLLFYKSDQTLIVYEKQVNLTDSVQKAECKQTKCCSINIFDDMKTYYRDDVFIVIDDEDKRKNILFIENFNKSSSIKMDVGEFINNVDFRKHVHFIDSYEKSSIFKKDVHEIINNIDLRKFIDTYKPHFKKHIKLPNKKIQLTNSVETILSRHCVYRLKCSCNPHCYFITNPNDHTIIILSDEKTKALLDEIYEMEYCNQLTTDYNEPTKNCNKLTADYNKPYDYKNHTGGWPTFF